MNINIPDVVERLKNTGFGWISREDLTTIINIVVAESESKTLKA